MSEKIKSLKSKKQQLFFGDGLWFGMGLMTAVTIFMMVILPALSCAVAITAAMLGVSLVDGLN